MILEHLKEEYKVDIPLRCRHACYSLPFSIYYSVVYHCATCHWIKKETCIIMIKRWTKYEYKDKPLWVYLLLCQFSRTIVIDYPLGKMTCLATDSCLLHWSWSWFLSCIAVHPQIQFIVLITFVSLSQQWAYIARLWWFQSGFTTVRGKQSIRI